MFIVLVHVHVKTEFIEHFILATLENARNSITETGITRFDVLNQSDDPTRFILFEVYRSQEDSVKHKETQHYKIWRDSVVGMMAEPRQGIKYQNIFPEDKGWE